MYTVYILCSLRTKTLYVGCSSDFERRLTLHKGGQVKSTKWKRPITVIHTEIFQDKADAFNRERFLKSLWGAREKKKILAKYLKAKSDQA